MRWAHIRCRSFGCHCLPFRFALDQQADKPGQAVNLAALLCYHVGQVFHRADQVGSLFFQRVQPFHLLSSRSR